MTNVMSLAKMEMKNHRFKILKYSLAVAGLCTAISLLFQQWDIVIVPLLLTFVINVIFLFGLNGMYLSALKHESYNFRTLFDIRKDFRKLLTLLLIYVGVLVLLLVILKEVSKFSSYAMIIMIAVGLLTIVLNCINHLCVFFIQQTDMKLFDCIKMAVKLFIQSKRMIVYTVGKTITYVFIGALLVYIVNVFVYALPLNDALYAKEVIDTLAIDAIFSSNISYVIQSVGIQMVVSYISLFSGTLYGTYYLNAVHS